MVRDISGWLRKAAQENLARNLLPLLGLLGGARPVEPEAPMDLDLLREKLPDLESWVFRTVSDHSSRARPVSSFGFSRLGFFYPSTLLQTAKVVVVPSVPMPPLSQMGLAGFEDFERMTAAGITYLDTYFVRADCCDDESLHFHELVHVVQWAHLGATNFILAYALGHVLSGG